MAADEGRWWSGAFRAEAALEKQEEYYELVNCKGVTSGEASVLMKNIRLLNTGVFKPRVPNTE